MKVKQRENWGLGEVEGVERTQLPQQGSHSRSSTSNTFFSLPKGKSKHLSRLSHVLSSAPITNQLNFSSLILCRYTVFLFLSSFRQSLRDCRRDFRHWRQRIVSHFSSSLLKTTQNTTNVGKKDAERKTKTWRPQKLKWTQNGLFSPIRQIFAGMQKNCNLQTRMALVFN